MNTPTLIIDVMGLYLGALLLVPILRPNLRLLIRVVTHSEDHYFFTYNQSGFPGNIARSFYLYDEHKDVDLAKPVFENVRTLIGLAYEPKEYIFVDGHKYKLVK